MVERKSTTAASGASRININIEIDSIDEIKTPRDKPLDVELLSLTDEQDPGGDPYNNTGQLCRVPQGKNPA